MKPRWNVALRFGVTLSLLGLLAAKIEWRHVGAILVEASPLGLLFVAAVSPLVVLGLAARLSWLLRRRRFVVPFGTAWRATWSGQFFNLCLPGSTGGDIIRIVELTGQDGRSAGRAAGIIFVDRFLALLALLVLATWAVLGGGFPLLEWLPTFDLSRVVLLVVAAAFGVAAAWWIVRDERAGWWRKLREFLEHLLAEVRACAATPGTMLVGVPLALSVHFLNFSLIYLLARALHLPLGYGDVMALMPVLFLVLMAPVTISGHGLREIFLVAYFGWIAQRGDLDATREHAIAFSVALVSADLVSSLPGGLWYLIRRSRRGSIEATATTPLSK